MFSIFEKLIDPFPPEEPGAPPSTLFAFCLHYIRPAVPVMLLVAVLTAALAILEVILYGFIGDFVDQLSQTTPAAYWELYGSDIIEILVLLFLVFPILFVVHNLLVHQSLMGNVPMVFRWQAHRYLLGHSMAFFNNEFAGRIGTKVMQTSLAVRETAMKLVDILTYVGVYFISILVMLAGGDWRLMIPFIVWLIAYVLILYWFIPRLRSVSEEQADARSLMTGRVVDSYTNISTVKLFSHAGREAGYARDSMSGFLDTVYRQMRLSAGIQLCVDTSLVFLLGINGWLCFYLWSDGQITPGLVAVSMSVIMRLWGMAHWIMWEMSALFENIGIVQDGMATLSTPRAVLDEPGAGTLQVTEGRIEFQQVNFEYGNDMPVIKDLSLGIAAGEKVGLVGRSGAGKTTLVNLLLRLYDIDAGRIVVDGQPVAAITQDSLRQNISVVTQDTSLLHRSIFDNIAYGRSNASLEEVEQAARRANAWEFIKTLQDHKGRTGFDAHVGERGVTLSGGQRQRIAIARVFLKNAPILVLDEATSALDSEVEAAIAENLLALMEGKTVIAIAHRLSTIAALDRLVVMNDGEVIEQGTHQQLVAEDGLYAQLWARQSGGFLSEEN